jgi:Flp pilus assembly protein TadD
MSRLTFILILLYVVFCQSALAETIKLKSGRIVNALIIDRQPNYVKVDLSGVTLTYYKDEIESIEFDHAQLTEPPPQASVNSTEIIRKLIQRVEKSVVIIDGKKDKNNVEGTGFFISADGLVVTNFHVVFKTRSIEVRTKDGASYPVQFVVNYNEDLDLCVLKVAISDAPALSLGDSDRLKPGEIIFTTGHREGSRYQTSSGPYVGKRIVDGKENLQSKMVTGHGNSGGPLIDQQGLIVGISKAFSEETGHNFAIPINLAKPFLKYGTPVTVAVFNEQFSPADELAYSGQGLLLEGKAGEALNHFKEAINLEPRNLKAWIGSAKAYKFMLMEKEESKAWQEVAKLDPVNVQAHVRLGKILLNNNSIDQGLAQLQKALELAPDTTEIYSDLGFAYGQKGMLNEAIASYKMAIELDPQDGTSHFNLAAAYFNKHDFTNAKTFSTKAQQLGYAVPESFLSQLKEAQKYGTIFEVH